jgi:methyl-accepting chemotaxis protein
MHARRFVVYGVSLGLAFPVIGTIIEAVTRGQGLGPASLLRAQAGSPLLWIIDTAPFFLTALAFLAGRSQDEVAGLDDARREGYLKTASELFTAAQALLSTVSSFSSMTAETAASVRETTATLGQLGQTATKAALTAETVIGVAHKGERTTAEGLAAVEGTLAEMMRLADEVRGLSSRVEALNVRMRDIFEIASVVNYITDRSQKLADRAAAQTAKAGAAGEGFGELVVEMRTHSDEAKRAAAQVKGILGEVHKAMLAAMTAAEGGIRRAEQGAEIASGTGETIRRLASALKESSSAAREIASLAQQQDHGIDQALKAMNEIYLATEETVTSTKAVATEAKALNDLARGLKRAVGG